MGNVPVLSAAGATVYLKASGVGSDADPFIPEHKLGAGTNNVGDVDVLSFVGDNADLDSGVGTDDHALVVVGLPGAGGHAVGGTGANPFRIDPVASTVMPSAIVSWFVGAQVVASVAGNAAVTASIAGIPTVIGSMNVGNFPAIQTVQGMAAHDAVATGNPALIGGVAQSAIPAIVATGDLVQFLADLTGAMVTRQCLPQNIESASLKGSGATTAQVLLNAAGSGITHNITSWQVINPGGSHGVEMCLHDGTSTLAVGFATASGGGFAYPYPTPLRSAANATLSLFCATASSPVLVNVGGYKGI